VSGFSENLAIDGFDSPAEYCLETAVQKVKSVASSYDGAASISPLKTVIVGADTIVEINGEVLEKPKDSGDAYRMLSTLSNSIHLVHTGVTIFSNSDEALVPGAYVPLRPVVSFVQTTKVKFSELTDEDIAAYIKSGEPFDKAGAYGIQGLGSHFVEHIEGCYFNVMGLPINSISNQMRELYHAGKL